MNEWYYYGVPVSAFVLGILLENVRSRVINRKIPLKDEKRIEPEIVKIREMPRPLPIPTKVPERIRKTRALHAPKIRGYYSTGEAERLMNASNGYLYNMAIFGRIKQHRIEGSRYLYYKKEDIEKLITQRINLKELK